MVTMENLTFTMEENCKSQSHESSFLPDKFCSIKHRAGKHAKTARQARGKFWEIGEAGVLFSIVK